MPADSKTDLVDTDLNDEKNAIPSSPGPSTGNRGRTESECSDKSGPRFILPGTSGSPPKIITLDEVQDIAKNIQNMALAHEIAVNTEFRLQPYEPPENSLEKVIKDTLHKAFWDILKEQLASEPPVYKNAIQLLVEIKENFQTVLINQKMLDRVNEILDLTVIQQQVDQGVLNFQSYADFVINTMAVSCAPVRDEQINKLREFTDVVETFRGILETLSLMRLDLANFLLDSVRNDVIANSIEYEKQKFKEYLEYYKYGFPATEKWLKRNRNEPTETTTTNDELTEQQKQNKCKDTIFNAYIELIDWNSGEEYPEMITMDQERVVNLQGRALRLCTCASVLAIATAAPVIGQSAETKKLLSKELGILLQNVNTNSELENKIENIWLHLKALIDKKMGETNQNYSTTFEEQMKLQILQNTKKDSPVRSLMWNRLITYIKLILRTNRPPPPPPGFYEFTDELENFATAFKRLSFYNYSVYSQYYQEILSK